MEYNNQLSRPWKRIPFGGISANTLRLLAMAGMLLDHLWGTVVPGNVWMTHVGRLVFPIYAFQLVEGFFHTSDRKQYMKRLLIFAVISEPLFDYALEGIWLYPFHQNTIFTLCLGLWAIGALDDARRGTKKPLKALLILGAAFLLSIVGFVDYGRLGLLTILLFYAFRGLSWGWLGQLAGMILINAVMHKGLTLPWLFDLPQQSLAVLALIPIWLYNGKKGRGGKFMQQLGYWYYPGHLLLLILLQAIL